MKKTYIIPEMELLHSEAESCLMTGSDKNGVSKASWGVNEDSEHSNGDWFNEGYQDGDNPVIGGDDWGSLPSTAKDNTGFEDGE